MLDSTSQHIPKRAVCYFRHSAEDKQENSVPIQREHAQRFALEHNIEIIHEEADEGKSGLLADRPGFKRLFDDWIENDDAPKFDYVLVYDVSRWGRFQDQNQAGHYVFLCKQKGIEVIYVSKGFPLAENLLISSLQTSIERYMAAEYSRQLSEKVFYGCVKISEQGYSAGGGACYGMSRLLIDSNKKPIRILKKGEHKQIANERVIFVPSDDETTDTVKKIFNLFVNQWYTEHEIAEHLNEQGIPASSNNTEWSSQKVLKILTNEIYIGTRIYNKTWGRLKQKGRKNPRSEWVVVPDAFPATVDDKIFAEAQERLYWLVPRRWRKGVNAIKRAQKNIEQDITNWFISSGLSEYEADEVMSELPVVFSVKLNKESASHWCFVISEHVRKYDHVLALSIVLDQKKLLDEIFMLSTEDFTSSNFLIFSEADSIYNNAKIENNEIEEKVTELFRQFKNSSKRYSKKYTEFNNELRSEN